MGLIHGAMTAREWTDPDATGACARLNELLLGSPPPNASRACLVRARRCRLLIYVNAGTCRRSCRRATRQLSLVGGSENGPCWGSAGRLLRAGRVRVEPGDLLPSSTASSRPATGRRTRRGRRRAFATRGAARADLRCRPGPRPGIRRGPAEPGRPDAARPRPRRRTRGGRSACSERRNRLDDERPAGAGDLTDVPGRRTGCHDRRGKACGQAAAPIPSGRSRHGCWRSRARSAPPSRDAS
jgi:hypothetical protein